MKDKQSTNSPEKTRLTIAGLLFFLAGASYYMGISTAQSFYPFFYDAKNTSVCELYLPINGYVPQPSATIFVVTMIVVGIMMLISTYLVHLTFRNRFLSISTVLHVFGMIIVTMFASYPWHMLLTIFVFASGIMAVIALYRIKVIDLIFRYVFLCLGIISLIFLLFYFNISPIMGNGVTESWIIYPQLFSMMGFGAYLIGMQAKKQ